MHMKKILYFFAIALAFVGIVGGFGYACYCHAYVIAAGLVVGGVAAFPQVREWVRSLMA